MPDNKAYKLVFVKKGTSGSLIKGEKFLHPKTTEKNPKI